MPSKFTYSNPVGFFSVHSINPLFPDRMAVVSGIAFMAFELMMIGISSFPCFTGYIHEINKYINNGSSEIKILDISRAVIDMLRNIVGIELTSEAITNMSSSDIDMALTYLAVCNPMAVLECIKTLVLNHFDNIDPDKLCKKFKGEISFILEQANKNQAPEIEPRIDEWLAGLSRNVITPVNNAQASLQIDQPIQGPVNNSDQEIITGEQYISTDDQRQQEVQNPIDENQYINVQPIENVNMDFENAYESFDEPSNYQQVFVNYGQGYYSPLDTPEFEIRFWDYNLAI